ncbi:MAG: trigger factor [Candidatus Fervidibacter sp.]|uniref:trigger factor n=1 Tax=Candidatus Fervidibacter sp. TaxID=3100871 RepID=UPI00404AB442
MQLASVQVEQKEQHVWELKVEVPAEEVQKVTNTVYRQLSRSIKVPGFRPGHIPPGLIKRWLGEEQIRQQILEDLLPKALMTALEQKNLEPVTIPEWRDVQFAEGQPLRFTAEVITKPEIKIGNYKGLKLKRVKLQVTEEMLNEAFEEVRQDLARYEPTNEEAREGDRVRVRYQVIEENEEQSEQWQSGTFVAGASGWTPPLPQNLVGQKSGEEGEFTFTYPDDYHNPQLAGKTVKVKFVIESVLRRNLPELTDEVVMEELGLESVEALKEELKRELEARLRRTARAFEKVQVEDELLKQCEVTIPNALIERFVNELLVETESSLKQRGLTIETWLATQGKTFDEYRNELRQNAERTLKLRFTLEAIAEREGITISDDELSQLVSGEQELNEEDISSLRRQLLEQKVMDLILTTAEWIESETSETNEETKGGS